MKIIKNKINLLSGIAAMFLLSIIITACDIVDEPYRQTTSQDTTKSVKRKILLEEFTGFRCKNCPVAAETIRQLLNLYGDQIIPISYHSGYFAEPNSSKAWSYDFRTAMGTAIDQFFGVSDIGNPFGMVSRINFLTKQHVLSPDAWDAAINSLKSNAPAMTIDLTPSYNSSSRTITADLKIKYLKSGTANQQLVVCILEDSVVKYQLVGNVDSLHYVHNHVFRGGMNGTWGEALSSTDIKAGTEFTKSYQYTIPSSSDWRPAKLIIVAYIYDYGQSYEVYQAEAKDLFK